MGDDRRDAPDLKELQKEYKQFWQSRCFGTLDLVRAIPIAEGYVTVAQKDQTSAKLAWYEGNIWCAVYFLRSWFYLYRAYRLVSYLLPTPFKRTPFKQWGAERLLVGARVMYAWGRFELAREMAREGIAAYDRNPGQPHLWAKLRLSLVEVDIHDGNCDIAKTRLFEIARWVKMRLGDDKYEASCVYHILGECFEKLAGLERGTRLHLLRKEAADCFLSARLLYREYRIFGEILNLTKVR